MYTVLKCGYNITVFDEYLFLENNLTTSGLVKYILSHVVIYFVIGLIFAHESITLIIFKTIIIEFMLVFIKQCSISNDIKEFESAFVSIVIGIISFYVGSMMGKFIRSYIKIYKD